MSVFSSLYQLSHYCFFFIFKSFYNEHLRRKSKLDNDLSNLFTQYGSVTSAKILKDKMNGRSKGFGFVEMEDDEAAKTAIASLNESEVQGRKLIVNESQPRPEGGGYKKSGGGG